MNRICQTDLEVFPLCLGGNVFGWTADEPTSFAVLDAYTGAGGNFIDTADSYPQWADGCQGGESETIIGRWLARRGRRDDVIIATKAGQSRHYPGLSPTSIRSAAEASLRRLGTGHIDLYYAHEDDPATPLADTMTAFDRLVREGKARYVAASNYAAPRLAAALASARQQGLVSFAALQVHYTLSTETNTKAAWRRSATGKDSPASPTPRWPTASSLGNTGPVRTCPRASAPKTPPPT
jgi:aryl-alcohol dehydrogenase-like predicted oxidoreductase